MKTDNAIKKSSGFGEIISKIRQNINIFYFISRLKVLSQNLKKGF